METVQEPLRPPTREVLLALIREHRANVERTVRALSESDLLAPLADGWTLKDHVAHIASWEWSLVELLQGRQRGGLLGVDAEQYQALGVDGVNALIFQRNQPLSCADVLEDFARAHTAVLEAIALMSDADLLRPYAFYQPDTTIMAPIIDWIVGNTYEHYQEHGVLLQRQ